MPKVAVFKQVKVKGKWMLAAALFDKRGRILKDRVRIAGKEEEHAEGNYVLQWFENGKRVKQTVGPDAQTAMERVRVKQAELSAVKAGLSLNGHDDPSQAESSSQTRTLLKSAVDTYLERIFDEKSLRTYRTYRPILNAFAESCPKMYVDEVDKQDLLDFATACKRDGQKKKSVFNKLVVLSQFMKKNDKPKLLETDDWPKGCRNDESERDCYEEEELKQLFAACSPDEKIRFMFYLFTGFRDAEGRFVTWRDVDFKNSIVRITEKPHWGFHIKNYKPRKVDVPKKLIDMLQKFRPAGAKPDDPIFPSETGRPDGAMLEKLKAVAYRAGLNCGHCNTRHGHKCSKGPFCKRWHLHKLRHTYATQQLRDGVDVKTLQKWLGHGHLSTTSIYLKNLPDKAAQEKINKGALTTLFAD